MSKADQGIAVLRKLKNIILRNSLLTIYNSFIGLPLDCVDIIYHQANIGSLCQKIEFTKYLQYMLTSWVKETQAMVQVSLYYFKIQSSSLLQYLNDLIPKPSLCDTTRFSPLPNFKVRIELFRISFFLHTVNEWNNLDNIIKSAESYFIFRTRMLKLIRPTCNDTYRVHNPTGLKLQTRLRWGLSHLNGHNFNHNFNSFVTEVDII